MSYPQTIRTCIDLRFCSLHSGRFLILLGVHHLARYLLTGPDGPIGSAPTNASDPGVSGTTRPIRYRSAVLEAGWPSPASSVLYNFEHVADQEDFTSSVMWDLLQTWGRHQHLWDYSEANVDHLHHLAATHRLPALSTRYVPLGYAPVLDIPALARDARGDGGDASDAAGGDIDVLFFGMVNDYRRARLQELRHSGIRVLHANANTPAFGRRLDGLLRRARIVLNLRFWAGELEWKMTRFLRPLANEVLIVSEICGSPAERDKWDGAVVFVNSSGLVPTIRWYLDHPQARRRRASHARDLFRSRPATGVLQGNVGALIQPACPGFVLR